MCRISDGLEKKITITEEAWKFHFTMKKLYNFSSLLYQSGLWLILEVKLKLFRPAVYALGLYVDEKATKSLLSGKSKSEDKLCQGIHFIFKCFVFYNQLLSYETSETSEKLRLQKDLTVAISKCTIFSIW